MKLVSASLAVLLFPLLLVVSGGIVTVTANAEAASVGGENQASADADANAVDESAAVVGGGSLRRGLNHRQRAHQNDELFNAKEEDDAAGTDTAIFEAAAESERRPRDQERRDAPRRGAARRHPAS